MVSASESFHCASSYLGELTFGGYLANLLAYIGEFICKEWLNSWFYNIQMQSFIETYIAAGELFLIQNRVNDNDIIGRSMLRLLSFMMSWSEMHSVLTFITF